MKKKVTIQMVAEQAGVSRGTVDRVLNNRSYVKDSVRQRVLDAMEELGYLSSKEGYRAALLSAQTPLPPLRLGVIIPGWTGYTHTEFLRGIEDAKNELRDFGVTVLVRECMTELPAEVIDLMDEFLAQDVAGISLCAVNDISIEQKINETVERGVPVITFNSDLPDSKRLCFIGQDYVKSGRIAADLMSKSVSRYAHILAMVGNLEFFGHRKRLDGFCARMGELGFSADRIHVEETYNDYGMTYKKVSTGLERTPRVEAVYMANRSVGGCVEAIRAAGKTGTVRVICHDVSETTKRLLREGSVDLAISQDIYRQGHLPLLLLREYLQKGVAPSAEQVNTNIAIYCAENV